MTNPATKVTSHGVSLATIRRVWAAVSDRPQASVRELAATSGISYSSVSMALRLLKAAGYIEFADGMAGARARTIVVPFIVRGT